MSKISSGEITDKPSFSPKRQFPPIAGEVYSLRRLGEQIRLGPALLPQIRVGGRFFKSSQMNCIADQGGQLILPEALAEVRHGDLVCISIESKGLKVQNLMTQMPSKMAVEKVLTCEVVVSPKNFQSPTLSWSLESAYKWAKFIAETRHILSQMGLQEVQTPTLVRNPGMEPELEPFSLNFKRGKANNKLFLATSPELHLKQLLSAGFSDIFEIKTVYRNEEMTEIHEPEFSMLEWYRAYADLSMIESDLRKLVAGLTQSNQQELRKYTVAEFFKTHTQRELRPDTQIDELYKWAEELKLSPSKGFDFNDLFQLIWLSIIEPNLPSEPFLLTWYPPSQAALARIGDHGWAERLEFYWHGLEIANAFHELNDPIEQRARFVRDQAKRLDYGRTALEIDENFMAALENGMPPSGGIALGLDRLFMAIHNVKEIRATRAWSVNHNL